MQDKRGAFSFIRKLALSLLPVALPLLAFGFLAVSITNDFISREIATMTSRQLDNLKDMVDVTMFELDALNLTFSVNAKMISTMDELLGGERLSMEAIAFSKTLGDILGAQTNARPYVNSIYFYLDRYPGRVYSVADGIMQLDGFQDTSWLDTYRGFPADRLLWTEQRDVRRFSFETEPEKLFTVYRRLYPASHGRTGAIVMNIERGHFEGLMARATQFPGQEVYLLDQDGRLILAEGGRASLSPLGQSLGTTDQSPLAKRRFGDASFYVYSSTTSRYGWRVVSIIPAAGLESVPIALKGLLLAILAGSFLVGLALTVSLVRRNARRVALVTDLLEKAESGENLPERPPVRHDEYDSMVDTLLRSFLRQRYAALQLSERQARAKVLELKALRAQMNPHFLFNTLDSLYWMVYGTEGVPSPAASMVKDLSVLLKYSLEESEEVSLADEIKAEKRYLAIQRVRYSDKFQVRWEVEEGAAACKVTKFFLQPLLENAVSHGIRNKEGPGRLTVRAALAERVAEAAAGGAGAAGRPNAALAVTVEDDGVGMSPERLAEVRASLAEEEGPADHIGLHNTHRHIQLVFGPGSGLTVESEAGRGTRIEVRFPRDR
jgi:two-component system sensor histidine kinase YesM